MVEAASFSPAIDGDLIVHFGKPFEQPCPLIRVHSECVFGELLDSDLCECAAQLQKALVLLSKEGHGLLFYLRLDGRGAGLAAKVKATALEVEGVNTYDSRIMVGVEPEGRDFHSVGQYLREHGVKRARLLTNSPLKVAGLADCGIEVTAERLVAENINQNERSLYRTKRHKFGHDIPDELV